MLMIVRTIQQMNYMLKLPCKLFDLPISQVHQVRKISINKIIKKKNYYDVVIVKIQLMIEVLKNTNFL